MSAFEGTADLAIPDDARCVHDLVLNDLVTSGHHAAARVACRRTARQRSNSACLSIVIARSPCDEAISVRYAARWIASRSLSSGAHSRDPLARNGAAKPR